MTDYTELVKRLRYAASYDPRTVVQDCTEAADAIEDLSQALDTAEGVLSEHLAIWIPVADMLPEAVSDYYVYAIGGDYQQIIWMGIAFWNGKEFCTEDFVKVTHWMPLPEPPEN